MMQRVLHEGEEIRTRFAHGQAVSAVNGLSNW